MKAPGKVEAQRKKMGLTIAIIVTIALCFCMFAGMVFLGMLPVIGRIESGMLFISTL